MDVQSFTVTECPFCGAREGGIHFKGCRFAQALSKSSQLGDVLSSEVSCLKKEMEFWQKTAAYLASCHVATLEYDGALKSCSESRRKRYRAIVEEALDLLEGKKEPSYIPNRVSWVIERLKKSLERGKTT
jgi:hypothetical protein